MYTSGNYANEAAAYAAEREQAHVSAASAQAAGGGVPLSLMHEGTAVRVCV
jgi:hypothetical protein